MVRPAGQICDLVGSCVVVPVPTLVNRIGLPHCTCQLMSLVVYDKRQCANAVELEHEYEHVCVLLQGAMLDGPGVLND